jgi:hypothetical protein
VQVSREKKEKVERILINVLWRLLIDTCEVIYSKIIRRFSTSVVDSARANQVLIAVEAGDEHLVGLYSAFF